MLRTSDFVRDFLAYQSTKHLCLLIAYSTLTGVLLEIIYTLLLHVDHSAPIIEPFTLSLRQAFREHTLSTPQRLHG